jgi:hypothetical protein
MPGPNVGDSLWIQKATAAWGGRSAPWCRVMESSETLYSAIAAPELSPDISRIGYIGHRRDATSCLWI